jgi:hypothetical protein
MKSCHHGPINQIMLDEGEVITAGSDGCVRVRVFCVFMWILGQLHLCLRLTKPSDFARFLLLIKVALWRSSVIIYSQDQLILNNASYVVNTYILIKISLLHFSPETFWGDLLFFLLSCWNNSFRKWKLMLAQYEQWAHVLPECPVWMGHFLGMKVRRPVRNILRVKLIGFAFVW